MNINMALFSDLHYSKNIDLNLLLKIKDVLEMINPNYIFFAGDFLDTNDFIKYNINKKELLLKWVEEISKKRKFIIVNGNHDLMSKGKEWYYDYYKSFWCELSSIENVYYDFETLVYNDENILVYGINLPFNYYENSSRKENKSILINYLQNNIKKAPNDNNKFKILLIHSPEYITDKDILNYVKEFDLVLCGHMHNGLVPNIIDKIFICNRGLIGPNLQLFPDNARGLKVIITDEKKVNIFISGGITKLSGSSNLSILNHLYRPEIDYINYDMDTKNIKIKKLYCK